MRDNLIYPKGGQVIKCRSIGLRQEFRSGPTYLNFFYLFQIWNIYPLMLKSDSGLEINKSKYFSVIF